MLAASLAASCAVGRRFGRSGQRRGLRFERGRGRRHRRLEQRRHGWECRYGGRRRGGSDRIRRRRRQRHGWQRRRRRRGRNVGRHGGARSLRGQWHGRRGRGRRRDGRRKRRERRIDRPRRNGSWRKRRDGGSGGRAGGAGSGGPAGAGGRGGTGGAIGGAGGTASGPFVCNQVTGGKLTYEWFAAGFENVVDNKRWQAKWREDAYVEEWADPQSSFWTAQIDSACVNNTTAPDRVVFGTVSFKYKTQTEWRQGITQAVNTIKAKYPGLKRMDLVTQIRGPNNMLCPTAPTAGETIAVPPEQDAAMAEVAARSPGSCSWAPRSRRIRARSSWAAVPT